MIIKLTKSSADSMGDSIRSTVKKAAKLAVYDEIMISVKNHHIPATIRVDIALQIFRTILIEVNLSNILILRLGRAKNCY